MSEHLLLINVQYETKDNNMEIVLSDRRIEIIEAAGKIMTRSGFSGMTKKNLGGEMNTLN